MPGARFPRASVVIPAHQEEGVIGRCLDAVLADAGPAEFDVVVVANGCTDGTVEVARLREPLVKVLELAEGSKPAALNAGDSAARTFPRIYVDADVELTTAAVRSLVSALDDERPLIAVPRRSLQLTEAPLLVKAYYRTWDALQRAREEPIGAGVYALNEAARRRFERFPDRVGDDTFVHGLFRRDERRVTDPPVKVWPPRRLPEVLAIRSRVAIGNLTAAPGPGRSDRPRKAAQARSILREPSALIGIPVYVLVTTMARARARARLRSGDLAWSRATRRSA